VTDRRLNPGPSGEDVEASANRAMSDHAFGAERCFHATSYAINLAHDVNFGTFELDADNFPPNWT
jgi:hypothetical protein